MANGTAREEEKKVQVAAGSFYGKCRLRSPSPCPWRTIEIKYTFSRPGKLKTFFLLLPGELPETPLGEKEDNFSPKNESDLLRALGLECSVILARK